MVVRKSWVNGVPDSRTVESETSVATAHRQPGNARCYGVWVITSSGGFVPSRLEKNALFEPPSLTRKS